MWPTGGKGGRDPWLTTGPPSHMPHCMTTSWPAAAARTQVRRSPAMHPKAFLCRMLSFQSPPYFQAWGPAHNMLACIPEARLTQ